MTDIFRNTFLTLCKNEPGIDKDAVKAALALLEGRAAVGEDDRILKREEVAAMIHKSVRYVDHLGKIGVLRRVVFNGAGRSSGILASSVVEAMRSGADNINMRSMKTEPEKTA